MAEFVKVTQHGLIAYEGSVSLKKESTILSSLRCRVELEAGITLGQIFKAVGADPILMSVLSRFSWCSVEAFHKDANLPPKDPNQCDDDEPLIELLVEPLLEFHPSNDFTNPSSPVLFEGVISQFFGIGSKGTRYSVSLTPMNELVQLPVRISPTVAFRNSVLPILNMTYHMSLLEFLDAIYFDISFYGGPTENAKLRTQIREWTTEIDNCEFD